jgi:hypothetical protein
VTLDSSFGLSGTIICGRVIVADVIPCNERGEAMTNPQA